MGIDSLNPTNYPQFRPGPGRYHGQAFEAAAALRQAEGYDLEVFCIPDDTNIDVAASSPFEGRVTVPPQSYLWAVAATSSQADGFDLQIRDSFAGQNMFGKRIDWRNASGQGSAAPTNPLFVLPKPWLILEPGLVVVQIFNRAAAVNTIQVALFVARPRKK